MCAAAHVTSAISRTLLRALQDRIVAVHRPWPQREQRTAEATVVHHPVIPNSTEDLQGTAAGCVQPGGNAV